MGYLRLFQMYIHKNDHHKYKNILMEYLNNKIVTPKDVEEHWQLPLIGVVPHIKEKKKIIGIKIK